jgi:hypothetical protein
MTGTDDKQPGRLEGHINAAEYWLNQADIYTSPTRPALSACNWRPYTHPSRRPSGPS